MNTEHFKSIIPRGVESYDSGFSNQANSQSSRLLDKKGQFNVVRSGLGRFQHISLVHELISMSQRKVIGLFLVIYVSISLLYAVIYLLIGMDHFGKVEAGTIFGEFKEAFFFSSQTLTTIGFGKVNPVGFWASLATTLEVLSGLFLFALAIGLIYFRLSRPVCKLKFSEMALISPHKTAFALLFRLANSKSNNLSQMKCQVLASLLIFEEDKFVRKYYNLPLEQKSISALSLSWTIVHFIDESSPLFGLNAQTCEEFELEILVTINGFDPAFSQRVQTRHSYRFSDLKWNAHFLPTFKRGEGGNFTILELDKLGSFEYVKPEN